MHEIIVLPEVFVVKNYLIRCNYFMLSYADKILVFGRIFSDNTRIKK